MRLFSPHDRRVLLGLVIATCTGCELQEAEPSSSVQVPWQLSIEFALETYDEPEYIARARLFDAAGTVLDPIGSAGTSLRLSEGDAVFAEGIHLDVETRRQWANRESFDYSAAVTNELQSYDFEFRRPNETISASIDSPPPFVVSEVGERDYAPGSIEVEWEPIEDERWRSDQHPIHDANRKTGVSIALEVLDDRCITLLDNDPVIPIAGAQNLLDSGSYRFRSDVYHSPDRDCAYDLIFERFTVKRVEGTWRRDDLEAPTNGVTAYARQTVRKRFLAKQR